MISTADFRNGVVIELEGGLYEIVEFQHVKPGKGGAFVRTRMKNILSARVLEKTFRSGERMEEARLEERRWQYLYFDGDIYHFMHPDTFEQIVVNKDVVGDAADWMKENNEVALLFHNESVLKVKAPLSVDLIITRCDPGIQGDRATGATKPATLETGVIVQVPLFVNEGEKIKVDTRSREYLERVG